MLPNLYNGDGEKRFAVVVLILQLANNVRGCPHQSIEAFGTPSMESPEPSELVFGLPCRFKNEAYNPWFSVKPYKNHSVQVPALVLYINWDKSIRPCPVDPKLPIVDLNSAEVLLKAKNALNYPGQKDRLPGSHRRGEP